MPDADPVQPPQFVERQYVPIGWWLAILGVALILGLEVLPLLPWNGLITLGIVLGLAALLLIVPSRTTVRVADGMIQVGKQSMPCDQVASVEELDQRNTRRAVGPEGDPAAWTAIRPWIATSVKVVNVQDDPPHFLISTRRPQELAAAIVACADRVQQD